MKKFLVITAEIIAVFAVFIAALVGVLLWRVSSSPIDLVFAKPRIEQALKEQSDHLDISFQQLILYWPDRKGPLLLGLKGTQVKNKDGQEIIAVDQAGIGISLPHLLIGQVLPTSLVLNKPALDVKRTAGGEFITGLTAQNAPPKAASQREQSPLNSIIGYIASPGTDDVQSPLKALKHLQITDASLTLDDAYLNTKWTLSHVDLSLQSEERGMSAALGANLNETATITVTATVPSDLQESTATIKLSDLPLSFLADKIKGAENLADQNVTINASLNGRFDQALMPLAVDAHIVSDEGHFIAFKESGVQSAYKDLSLKMKYTPGTVNLTDLSASLEGVPFSATASAKESGEKYLAKAKLVIPTIAQAKIKELWPEFLQDRSAYKWLGDRLSNGTFTDLTFDIDGALNETRSFTLGNAKASFDYQDMTIDYRSPMPAITNGAGAGWFDYQSELLHIDLASGKAGNLTLGESEVELAHIIEGGKGYADVNVGLSGDLADVFKFLSKDPIALNTGYDLKRMSGQSRLTVNLGIPTYGDVDVKDLDLNVRGTVNGALIPHIIEQTDLTQASANVLIDGNDLTIAGKGLFGQENITFDYKGYLNSANAPFKESIKISGTASEDTRKRLKLDLSTFMRGPAQVTANYINYGAKQTIDITADLKKSTLFVEPFAYEKLPNIEAQTKLRVNIKDGHTQEINALQLTAPNLSISQGRLIFVRRGGKTELTKGDVPSAQIGESKGRVEFDVLPSGQYRIAADLEMFDGRLFLNREKKAGPQEDNTPIIISLNAQQMLTHKKFGVRDVKIYLDMSAKARFNQLEMDAMAGDGAIYLRYKPDPVTGQRNFRFEADNAGATLMAFGLYDKIRGGKISISAEPMGGLTDQNLIGKAQITNFEVVDAPALARLLSLMSIEGLVDAGRAGIQFSRLESQFDWLYRPQGSMLVLQEGRTSGNAVGLTFDGTVDQAESIMNVKGTIVPVSQINKVIGSIPVLGEILTAGSGVFAATYSVKGDTKDPDISINPLSVLAPGILRKILFE